jgi:hypothetical protein
MIYVWQQKMLDMLYLAYTSKKGLTPRGHTSRKGLTSRGHTSRKGLTPRGLNHRHNGV